MAKKKSTFLNMTVTLFLISAVSSTILASIYVLTTDIIKEAREKKIKESISAIIPAAKSATSIEEISKISLDVKNADSLCFYIIRENKKIIGTAVKSYTDEGFSGRISIMVGFDEDGNIIDTDVLEHQETPGLGNKIAKSVSNWNEQFKGKNPQSETFKVKKDKGDIDALTAATISSRAYIDAIKRASYAYEKYFKDYIFNQNSTINNQNLGKEGTNNE